MHAFASTPATTIIEAYGITRDIRTPGGVIRVLQGIDLSIQPGEFVALRGCSGSGKTTLLNILAGLDNPTQGTVRVLGQELATLNENRRAALRLQQMGLLFQNAHLLPALTALENVELALRLLHIPAVERSRRASESLKRVHLSGREEHRSLELSGGEQQRVALARALVHQPRLLLADEPTGHLDSQTAQKMAGLFRSIAGQTGLGLLVATHDAGLIKAAHRVLNIEDGRLR
jgi:putative ABC transport system ATP-binding protein